MRHKWNIHGDVCLRCGLVRIRRSRALLMAITDFPPYNHYRYEQYWEYNTIEGNLTHTRPECKKLNSEQNVQESDTTEAESNSSAGNIKNNQP